MEKAHSFEVSPKTFAALKNVVEELIVFHKHLGLQLTELTPGFAKMYLPYQDFMIGNPIRPALHGGVLATVLDGVGGAATMTTFTSYQDRISTIDLRVDYLRPADKADMIAEGRVIRSGNSVVVAEMCIYHKDPALPLAVGRGAFSVIRKTENA